MIQPKTTKYQHPYSRRPYIRCHEVQGVQT